MKRYKVYVYNTVDKFWDCYEVLAEDRWTPGTWQCSG